MSGHNEDDSGPIEWAQHDWPHSSDTDSGGAMDLTSVPHVDVSALDAPLHHGHDADEHGLPVATDGGPDHTGQYGSGEWAASISPDSGVAADGSSDHPLIYPPAVPPQFESQSDDPVVNIYDSVDTGMAGDASSLWAIAYPGQPWPYDGEQPEEPAQLMEHIVGDTTVPEAVRQTADNWLTANGVNLDITTAPTNTVWESTDPVTVPVTAPVDDSPVAVPVSDTTPVTQPTEHTASPTTNPTTDPTSPADPSAHTSDPDLGNPDVQQDLQYWFYQDTNHTCAPSSATEIINEYTGTHYANENTVANYAQQHGWLSDNGMQFDKLPALLAHFGVPASEQSGGDTQQQALATLARTVDDEHKSVVMSVNAPEYWYPDHGKSEGGPELHAVRIVDVDLAHGTAILSDTGDPKGKGSVVPLSDLMNAWAEGTGSTGTDYPMVVTSAVDPAYADSTSSPTPHPAADPTTSAPATTTPTTTTPTVTAPTVTAPTVTTPTVTAPTVITPASPAGNHETRELLEFVILPITVGIGLAAKTLRR